MTHARASVPASIPLDGHPGRSRLASLDGLRGLAAAGVALHHVFYHFAPWPWAPGVIAGLTGWLHTWGWTLVDLFFVLSGYVFAHVYLRGDALATSAGRAQFAAARVARLYPLHLAALALFALIEWGNPYNTAGALLAHLAMLQAFAPHPGETFNYASWSLSVEAACYALFVAAATGGRRLMLGATGLFIAAAAVKLALNGAPGAQVGADMFSRGLLGFFVGQALWHGRARLARVPSAALVLAAVSGFALRPDVWSPLLPLTLLAWPAVLLLALRIPALAARPLLWLGDRSYSIYLLNLAVILPVAHTIDSSALGPWPRVAVQAAMLAGVLLCSDWSYRWLERPARRILRAAMQPRHCALVPPVPATGMTQT